MDLARRLSSLRDFISAANELTACDDCSSHYIKRHCRKIVTLIEIARTTLTRSGVKLHHARPCMPALQRYKAAYLDMLRMLERQRSRMQDDRAFQERVDRLLLPLAATPRHGVAEDTAGPSSVHSCLSGAPSLFAPPPPPPPLQAPRAGAGTAGAMLPPDVLLGRPSRSWTPDAWKQGHLTLSPQRGRPSWHDRSGNERDEGSDDEDDEPQPVLVQQSRRRFGIFCTGKQGSRRPGGLRR